MQQYFSNLHSLTQQKTNHMEAHAIFEIVRHEKDELEKECMLLKNQRSYLEKNRNELVLNIEQLNSEILESEGLIKHFKRVIEEDQSHISDLNKRMEGKDTIIGQFRSENTRQSKEIDILKKSISTKDCKISMIVKERNKLNCELQSLRRSSSTGRKVQVVSTDEKLKSPPSMVPCNSTFSPQSVNELILLECKEEEKDILQLLDQLLEDNLETEEEHPKNEECHLQSSFKSPVSSFSQEVSHEKVSHDFSGLLFPINVGNTQTKVANQKMISKERKLRKQIIELQELLAMRNTEIEKLKRFRSFNVPTSIHKLVCIDRNDGDSSKVRDHQIDKN